MQKLGIHGALHPIMKRLVFSTNNLSLSYLDLLLRKCMKCKALRPGKQVHAHLLTKTGLNIYDLDSKLVGMYTSCGDLTYARLVFDKIPEPTVFAFNWMVLGSTFNGNFHEAIGHFNLMRNLIGYCNKFTFSFVLKAFVGLLDLKKGKEVHALVNVMGLGSDVLVGNGLVDMYNKCGEVCCGRRIFDRIVCKDVVSWTSMICGYCNVGKIEQAVVLFERMKLEGLEPNEFTWNGMITGYARRGDSNGAYMFFSRMVREGLVPDLVTWNAIISGFAQSQRANEALKLFQEMLLSGIKPNEVTISGLLPACGLMDSIQRGKGIHGLIYRMGLDYNVFIASALIDMYSKCGSVKDARRVFDLIRVKNVASWNAMIGCYGKQGMVDSAIELFERMQEEGMQLNDVTFTSVLSACSHGGSVAKGSQIFRSMKERYRVEINQQHYACVVDMLCRSGRILEAYELIRNMPVEITDSIAGAFFNGCQIHGSRDLAKMMAKDILKMDMNKPGGFVSLSNIYAADGEWYEVENVRKVMKGKSIHKKPGFSWVQKQDQFAAEEIEKESNKLDLGYDEFTVEEDEGSKVVEAVEFGS
ncbi:pentatricopeptide repeat-containing protein At5g59600-like [Mangifera indica]|uniref:pentatricopeptide repeat-containing protein At5g59600-like n=1 Tax=Mangifera indica TaxID=29780 RepID=UPI001CFA94B4|nr:pentatricopeptide repeat-containing protein At5g59600-like [Mangifera indica]